MHVAAAEIAGLENKLANDLTEHLVLDAGSVFQSFMGSCTACEWCVLKSPLLFGCVDVYVMSARALVIVLQLHR